MEASIATSKESSLTKEGRITWHQRIYMPYQKALAPFLKELPTLGKLGSGPILKA